jgi:hypothetical protein
VRTTTGWTRIKFESKPLRLLTPMNSGSGVALCNRRWEQYMHDDFTYGSTRFVRAAHGSSAVVIDTTTRAYEFDGAPKQACWMSNQQFKDLYVHKSVGCWEKLKKKKKKNDATPPPQTRIATTMKKTSRKTVLCGRPGRTSRRAWPLAC